MGRPTTNTPSSAPRSSASTTYSPPPHLCYAPLIRPIPLPHIQGSPHRRSRSDIDPATTAHRTNHESLSSPLTAPSSSSHSYSPRSSERNYPNYDCNRTLSNALRLSGMVSGQSLPPTRQHDVSVSAGDNARANERPSPRASMYQRPPLDMRCDPQDLMREHYPATAQSIWTQPAVSTGANAIRVISPNYRWPSIIRSSSGGVLTWGEFVTKLNRELQLALGESDWSMADERKRAAIVRAHRARRQTDPSLRRVDWLEDQFVFCGLYKDETLICRREMPGQDLSVETWVVKFGSSSSS